MSLKLTVSIAAMGVSLLATQAYADGEGGEGTWEPPAFHAATKTAPGDTVGAATGANAAPRLASPGTRQAGIGGTGPVVTQPSSFGAMRPSAWPYEESDIPAAEVGHQRSELSASKPVARRPDKSPR